MTEAHAPYTLTLVGAPLPSTGSKDVIALLETFGATAPEVTVLSSGYAMDVACLLPEPAAAPLRKTLAQIAARFDWCLQPSADRRKRLLIADMDSTIVTGETIDELAALAGVGPQVAEITAQAMNGALDFEAALRARVALLRGLRAEALQEVAASLTLSPGAAALIATMRAHGAECGLVSGGFDAVTAVIREKLGFNFDIANHLAAENGALTGEPGLPIVTAQTKVDTLLARRDALGLTDAQTAAVGDGANDLLMVRAAGLGVAYRAKPTLRAEAFAAIDHTDLKTLLYFQGYSDAQITQRL